MAQLACGLAAASLASQSAILPAEATAAGDPLATLTIAEHREFVQVGGSVVIKATRAGDLLIVRSSESAYAAMSVVCPHLQCSVKVKSSSLIRCPCHQSAYKLDGSYISGPAKSGLHAFPLRVEQGVITVLQGEQPKEAARSQTF
jgi:Rieske Fe-S protein